MSSEKLVLLKLSKKELIKICKQNKLSTFGNKHDIVQRILQCKQKNKPSVDIFARVRVITNQQAKQQPKKKISTTSTFDLRECTLCIYKHIRGYNSTLKSRTKRISQLPSHRQIILLSSNTLINKDVGLKLVELIRPLQNNAYNYRDEQFIKNRLNFQKTHWDYPTRKPPPKIKIDKRVRPKLQELINKFEHLDHNKRMLNMEQQQDQIKMKHELDEQSTDTDTDSDSSYVSSADKHQMPIAPAIFSIKEKKFLTEINGLLYSSNVELYKVIENVFYKFISMFECCLKRQLMNKYATLSVIVTMQDYQFVNANDVIGIWHSEGRTKDNIAAVGLYYFDLSADDGNKNKLIWKKNILQVAEEACGNDNIQSADIEQNNCIVFTNSMSIKHRAKMETKYNKNNKDENENKAYLSRKVLCFFLLNPKSKTVANCNVNEFNWINFPWKVDLIVNYWYNIKNKGKITICNDIIILIGYFAYGDDTYKHEKMTEFRKSRRSIRSLEHYHHPFEVIYTTSDEEEDD